MERKIAFKVEFSRILELLADQIYQSPLALLRENTQNAFDAIRMREALHQQFNPIIEVTVDSTNVTVGDNGIGMTPQEIEASYWYAGRSGKNTAEARAAGVVGTFGIGAMANFGVADELSVESESAISGERTFSSVQKSELSTDTEGISLTPIESRGQPGTVVQAKLADGSGVRVNEARAYLRDFVEFVDIPVLFNGELLSRESYRSALPSERYAWMEQHKGISLDGIVAGDLELLGMASGELRVVYENIEAATGLGRNGAIILQQGRNAIRTQRSGFGLATVTTQSIYRWGGVVDLPFLKPTAGREALDASSNQMLQRIVAALDNLVSELATNHAESFNNDGFLQWIVNTRQFSLCGKLEANTRPTGHTETLESLIAHSNFRFYSGRNESIIQTHASEEAPLVVLSRRAPRRNCELGYLTLHEVREIDTSPQVTNILPIENQSFAHTALAVRIARILEDDYFLHADIRFGSITGELPLLVTNTGNPVEICLDPLSTSVAPLLNLYNTDYSAFRPFVTDFVRTAVFQRISNLVPSSTRQGSEAFLRYLHSNRELFEYELEDRADLEEVFEDLRAGRVSIAEATRRIGSTGRSYLEVSSDRTAPLSTVIQEIGGENEDDITTDPYSALPSIDRREEETDARILTSETPINGYTCFLSLSDRVQREKGDFFLQPHSTEVVWGGRKVIFIFQHHSGQFGLYYDILCPGLVSADSSGGPEITSTILTKGRTFIPIPSDLIRDFLPDADERKRLQVRCDILYLENHKPAIL